MAGGKKLDRRGSGPLWFVMLAVVIFVLYSAAVAIGGPATTAATGRSPGSSSRPSGSATRHPASGDRAARPLVRAGRRAPRARPTCATRSPRAPSRRSTSSSTALGLRAGHAGARRRLRARAPRPRPRRARARGRGRRHQPALRRPRHRGRARRGHVPCGPTPAPSTFDAEFDVAMSLCQGAFGLTGGPGARSTATAPCWRAWPGPCGPAAGSRCRPSPPTSSCATSRTRTASTPTPASTTSAPRSATRPGTVAEVDLWTTCFTPRELRLLGPAAGLEVEHLWSVTPGAYAAEPRRRSTRPSCCWSLAGRDPAGRRCTLPGALVAPARRASLSPTP